VPFEDQVGVTSGDHTDNDVVTVHFVDAGLMHMLDAVQIRVETLLETAPRLLVVDLGGLARLSSTAVAALLWVRRRCLARGVAFAVTNPSRRTATVLERIGFLDDVHQSPVVE
jgi:anti-anti-sigma factor